DGDDDIGFPGGLFGGAGTPGAGGQKRLHAGTGAVPNRYMKPAAHEIEGHGAAHDAKTDETDAFRPSCLHRGTPSLGSGRFRSLQAGFVNGPAIPAPDMRGGSVL